MEEQKQNWDFAAKYSLRQMQKNYAGYKYKKIMQIINAAMPGKSQNGRRFRLKDGGRDNGALG